MVRSVILSAVLLASATACTAETPDDVQTADQAEQASAMNGSDWRTIDPENLIQMETPHGSVTIELNSDFAPKHVERFRTMVRDQIYNGERFYRVIDGFVAQAGLQDETRIATFEPLVNENDRPLSNADFIPLGNRDLFAPEVGHIDSFAVGRSTELGQEWLLHCPGVLAMARNTDPDTGGTEFYITLAPQRYLDRNLTVFGRVIDGMPALQKLKRGVRAIESGVIQAPDQGDKILSMHVVSDQPEKDRGVWQVQAMPSAAFDAAKTAKRVREEAFFYRKPPEILDICGFEVPVQKIE